MPDFVKFLGLAAIFMLLIIFTWLLQLYALGIYFTIANELGINDRNGGRRSIEELLLNPMPEVTEADEQLIPSWLMDSSHPCDEFETSSDSSPSSSEGEFLLRGPFENDNVISAPDPSPDPSLDGVPSLLNPQGTNENITDVSFEYLNDETGSAQRAYMNLIYDDASLEIWAYQTEEFSAPENNTASEQSDINNENARVAMSWFTWSNGTSLPNTLLPQTIPSPDDGMSFTNPLDGTLGETNSGTSNAEEQDDMNQHIEENASVPDVDLRGDSGEEVIDAETGARLAIQLALQLIFMYIIMMRNNMEENRALCQLNDLDLGSEPEQEVDLGLEDNTLAGLDSNNDEMESNFGRDSPPLSWFNFVTEEIPEIQPEYYMFQYFDEEFDNDNLDSNCMNEPDVLDIEDPDDQPEELVEEWENNNSDEEDTVACQCQGACACPHDDEWETISSSSRYSDDSTTSAESSRSNSLTTASRPDILQNLPERSCEEQENTEELEGSDESDLDALDLPSVCKNFYLNHMEIHEESAQSYLTEAMENHLIDFEGINILQLAVVYIKLVYSARRLARLVLYNVSTDLFSNFECGSALLEFQTMFNRIVDNEAIHNPEGAMMLAEIYHMYLSRARILERCQGTWVEDLINILSEIYGHQSTLTVDFYAREFQEQECLLIAELFVNISSCLSGCLEFGQTVLAILAASFRYWVPNGFNVLLDGVDSEDGEHDGTVSETDDSCFCQFNTEGNFENAISFVTEDQEAIVMTNDGEIERGEGNHEYKGGELEKPKDDEIENTNEYEEYGDQEEVEEAEEEEEEEEEEDDDDDDDDVVEENEKNNDEENEGSSLEGNIEDSPRGSISPSVSKN